VLVLWVSLLTTVLSTLAIAVYVLAYTPMKRLTPAALPVGAFAGAMPPLLGWTAATNTLSAPGLLLFGVLFVWQLPHFLAISMFRKADYERAGIKTVPAVHGDRAARWLIASTSGALLSVSVGLAATDAVGAVYSCVACILGVAITAYAVRGLMSPVIDGWSRRTFFATLAYLPALALGMLLDATLR
jgi:protoheme IX farnesyltransferase